MEASGRLAVILRGPGRCQDDATTLPRNLESPTIRIAGSGGERSDAESSSPCSLLGYVRRAGPHMGGVEEQRQPVVAPSDLDQVGRFPRRSGSPTWGPPGQMQPLARASCAQHFRHITPWGPSLTGQPAPNAHPSRDVPDSVFATMSLPQPQPQPRASPLIPRPVPAPTPRTKSFSLPNALSRVGTPVPKGTWILGRGHDPDDNGYVRTISQAPRVLGTPPEPEPPS